MTIDELYNIIMYRKKQNYKASYVASLLRSGKNRVAQKVGEEAIEVVIAACEDKEKLIEEIADLWFHTLILLAAQGIEPSEIFSELQKRHEKTTKDMLS